MFPCSTDSVQAIFREWWSSKPRNDQDIISSAALHEILNIDNSASGAHNSTGNGGVASVLFQPDSNDEPYYNPNIDIYIPKRGGGSAHKRQPGFARYTELVIDRAQVYHRLPIEVRREKIKKHIINRCFGEGRKIIRFSEDEDKWVAIDESSPDKRINNLTQAIVQKISDYIKNCKKKEAKKKVNEDVHYVSLVYCIKERCVSFHLFYYLILMHLYSIHYLLYHGLSSTHSNYPTYRLNLLSVNGQLRLIELSSNVWGN